jgi:L,D-transpeptidase YcbB
VTYFTARVDENGKLQTFNDLYGHDAKLTAALAGKPVKLEDPVSTAVSRDETLSPGTPGGKQAKNRKGGPPKQEEAGLGNLLQGLFGN